MGCCGSSQIVPHIDVSKISSDESIQKRIYAFQKSDASVELTTSDISSSPYSILLYRSKYVSLPEQRIILLRWLLHSRHHLETIVASHDQIRDMMDRINILTKQEIVKLANSVYNKEIGKHNLENEPKK
jgi:hypothetical protein